MTYCRTLESFVCFRLFRFITNHPADTNIYRPMSSMDDPTIAELTALAYCPHTPPLTESEKIEFKKDIQNACLKSSSLPSYYVMTINMNGTATGKGVVDDRRMLLSKILDNFCASVIFCQELPGFFKKKVVDACVTYDYDFVANGSEAAVMWCKEHFDGEPVDTTATSSMRIKERLDERSDIDTTEVLTRTAMVKLQSRGEAYQKYPSFLAVSWHGPHRNLSLEEKGKAFNGLTCFLQEVCKEKNVSCVIIGGDFNLNTLDLEDEDLKSLNVTFPGYELSSRSKEKQRESGGHYIPYKDNFAFFTISGSNNPRPMFKNIRVHSVRPFEFVDAEDPASDLSKEEQQEVDRQRKEPNIERKDLLDHDPIVGVLELLTIVKQTGKWQVLLAFGLEQKIMKLCIQLCASWDFKDALIHTK